MYSIKKSRTTEEMRLVLDRLMECWKADPSISFGVLLTMLEDMSDCSKICITDKEFVKSMNKYIRNSDKK